MIGDYFFQPKSVAVVGASAKPQKIGFSLVKNLLDGQYRGKIYPINLAEKNILGLTVYQSLLLVPGKIDLVIIAVPAAAVETVVAEAIKKHLKYAIIISAGFAESGKTGREAQERIVELAKNGSIRLLGPNCLGVISPPNHLNASFATTMPEKSNIAVLSQSGAICTAILDWANKKGIGFTHFISLGNKADLEENDFLPYLANEPATKAVALYLESVRDGNKLKENFTQIGREKPLVVVKSGRNQSGQKAAASHTAALTSNDLVFSALCKRCGVIRADSLSELFKLMMTFTNLSLPENENILVITNAGGPGVITADFIGEQKDLRCFSFNEKQIKYLQKNLDSRINLTNPLDLQGDATSDRFQVVFSGLALGEEPGLKIVILTPQANTDIKKITDLLIEKKDSKTMVVLLGGASFLEAEKRLNQAKIPVFHYPKDVVETAATVVSYASFRRQKERFQVVKGLKKAAQKALDTAMFDENTLAKLLAAYEIPLADSKLVTTEDQAVLAAKGTGYPVVLKISSPDILHKTEIGAVKVGLESEEAVREAYRAIVKEAKKHFPEAFIHGVTVYKMVRSSVEIAIGAKRDPVFGPYVIFGLGGIYIEIFKDFQIELAPVTLQRARQMIKSIRSFELLNGYRQGQKFDLESIARAISGLSSLMIDHPQIKEIDINPIRFNKSKKGIIALDAKIIFKR